MDQSSIPAAVPANSVLETADTVLSREKGELQSLIYKTVPLCELPQDEALALCRKLYSPNERFAQGFYRYRLDTLHMPEAQAWQETLDELEKNIQRLTENLHDPKVETIGFNQQGQYVPVGLYAFRPLQEHPTGKKLIQNLEEKNLMHFYPGSLAIAHSFSALNGYRSRFLMKYAFALIALKALQGNVSTIFFFMSDHRLGPIYKRFGLEFPEHLEIPGSKHLVGCYTFTDEKIAQVYSVAEHFGILQQHPSL